MLNNKVFRLSHSKQLPITSQPKQNVKDTYVRFYFKSYNVPKKKCARTPANRNNGNSESNDRFQFRLLLRTRGS